MPELPEVETVRRRVHRALHGARLTTVRVAPDPIILDGVPAARVSRALHGRTVTGTGRWGKHFWIELDRRPWPVIHLGMTGWIEEGRVEEDPPRYWKLLLGTEDGRRVALTNRRRLGRVRLAHDPRGEPPLVGLGADPLLAPLSRQELALALSRRRGPIKMVLLDQALFAGVGNWIADEVLYQSGIAPHRPARELSQVEVGRLRTVLVRVIRKAVAVDADADRFPRTWLFHVRWGKRAAHTRRGEPIRFDTIGGRTTAWVPDRQR
jgi:formamidopyrimidine-DNA glycosylase